ncbi:MAG: tetratricopeptide repeat protein [Wenzhouxiangella sp.]|jgi:tetratricopeptide (TPR) repeat protein|nr:tetratricopeptide repeat protein [Wenzhouxiangella sp.]
MSPDALLNEARGLLAGRRFDQAAEVCRAGLSEQPAEPDLLTILALCEQAQGQGEIAADHLGKAVAADDQHLPSRFHLARLLASQGQNAEADDLFAECLALDPNHAPARTLRARLAGAAGDRQRAIAELKTALRADPDHRPALTSLAELLVEDGQTDLAHEIASRALAIDPDHPSVQLCMARVLVAREHHDFAIQCLNNAVEKVPADPRPRLALVELLDSLGREQEALVALDAAASDGVTHPSLTRLRARIARRQGRNDEAAALYASLLASVKADPDLILEAAEFALATGRPGDAAGLIRRSSVQGRPETRLLAARLAEAEGDAERARSEAGALIDAADQSVAAAARKLLARLALATGDLDEADALLSSMIRAGEPEPDIVWLAARVREDRGQIDGAIDMLQALLDRSGLDDAVRDSTRGRLAALLDQAGRYEAAAAQLPERGWQAPFLGQSRSAGPIAAQVRQRLTPWRWDQEPPNDGRPLPVFVSGWPGSGRELLLAALAESSRARLQPVDEYPARRSIIGLPASIEAVVSLDDGTARVIRRKCLRPAGGAGEGIRVLVETGLSEAPDWPMLARIFPGAVLLCPRASDEDLMLHWRFQGFRDRSRMLDAWHEDCRLQDELAGALPLRVAFFDLAELLDAPELALNRLCDALGLASEPAMLEAIEQQPRTLGFRPIGHWRQYGD